MEVPRLGVKEELQLPVYTTATATPDQSYVCDLHHSLWQHQILNPLSEARDQTLILMDTSQVLNLLSHNGNSVGFCLFVCFLIYTRPFSFPKYDGIGAWKPYLALGQR